MQKKIAILMGTRPEAIKLAPVVAALAADPKLEPLVVNTGQHRELIDQVITLFGLNVDRDLAVMRPNQSLAELTGRLVSGIDEVLVAAEPDMVLVQGDTTTVLSGALAAFYRRTPVAHVEAGLRTGLINSPFPEEANRRLTTTLASLHFAPTDRSRDNLLAEGVDPKSVTVTGNTVIDALELEVARQKQPEAREGLANRLKQHAGDDLFDRPMILVTGHRRENFGAGFGQICDALARLAEDRPRTLLVYPVHLNPNVQGVVKERLGGFENIRLIPPQPYSEFVALLNHSRLILTDSGGVQEEAPSLGKPVLVMRNDTERPEGVDAGAVRLVGPNADRIVAEATRLLDDQAEYNRMAAATNPYGDGQAAARIIDAIGGFLGA